MSKIIKWAKGKTPISVLMISLNEEENLIPVLENLKCWADEVFLVDSYSNDKTIDIGISYGINIVQREFKSFGDQWNFAAKQMPIRNKWVMKIDPDERITTELKNNIDVMIKSNSNNNAYEFKRHLWFMGKPLGVKQNITRVWRHGKCVFSDVLVNEHPIIDGKTGFIHGDLDHLDSPTLHHWVEKQNIYTTLESTNKLDGNKLSASPKLTGNTLERRMWLKNIYNKIPLRHLIYFLYCYLYMGAIKSGRAGFIWSKLRVQVFKMREYKSLEMTWTGNSYKKRKKRKLKPDCRVKQY